jgi:hypothetical protein
MLYIWDNVRIGLTHLLFDCTMYVGEFFQFFLQSFLSLVTINHSFGYIHCQTARQDSLILGVLTVGQTNRHSM